MKYSYAIGTDFHGRQFVARFKEAADRDAYCRGYGIPELDPSMGACWDTGQKGAEAVLASHPDVRAANRADAWRDAFKEAFAELEIEIAI